MRLKFRDVYRGDNRTKNFSVYIENYYRFSKYITKTSFFIAQNNVEEIFNKKTDGEIWGFELGVLPHESIELRVRYNEQYLDDNSSGQIGDSEIKRNFAGNVLIDSNYWWKKYKQWRKERAINKEGK